MSTSENKPYLVFNEPLSKVTLRRDALVACLEAVAGHIGAVVTTHQLANDRLRVTVAWGIFIATVLADGAEELPNRAFQRIEMSWTRSDQPLHKDDLRTIDVFMHGTTHTQGRGKRRQVYKVAGFIQLFDNAATHHLNQ